MRDGRPTPTTPIWTRSCNGRARRSTPPSRFQRCPSMSTSASTPAPSSRPPVSATATALLCRGSLFELPEENPPVRSAIEFYQHRHNWTNRLVAGDSLLVMNSLLEKEGMAGKVQMVYVDPPYGIRYGSNFQPFVNRRDVRGRPGRGPDPRAGDYQGLPRHLGVGNPLLPVIP